MAEVTIYTFTYRIRKVKFTGLELNREATKEISQVKNPLPEMGKQWKLSWCMMHIIQIRYPRTMNLLDPSGNIN